MTKGTKTTEKKEREYIKITNLNVDNVRAFEGNKSTTVFFTLIINGVSIYNCKVVEGKNGDFISFPQTKGSNEKWYNVAYAAISPEDSEKILTQVQTLLDKQA